MNYLYRKIIDLLLVTVICHSCCATAEVKLPVPSDTEPMQHTNRFNQIVQHNWIPDALQDLNKDAIYNQDYTTDRFTLPDPETTKQQAKFITLRDAILLALRFNIDIKASEIQRVEDKFAVILAHNVFEPEFKLGVTGTYNPNAAQGSNKTTYDTDPSVSVTTGLGTNITVDSQSALDGTPATTTVKITQPLLKGFGAQKLAYDSALLDERVNKLGFKNKIMTSVVAVINAYRNLIGAYNELDVNKRSLESQKKALGQMKLKLKVGKVSRSDYMQQQTSLETAQLSYVQQQDSVSQTYQSLLATLGLTANAHIRIDKKIDIKNHNLMSLHQSVVIALRNNIDFQTALLNLQKTKISLLQAKDSCRWGLGLTLTKQLKNELQQGSESAVLGLTIPVDDVSAKSSLITAEIALENAKIALAQSKQNLITQVYNSWKTLHNQQLQLSIAKKQVKLQKITLDDAKIKQRYGRATLFEVLQIQNDLLGNETSYISAQIDFLNGLSKFNQLLGLMLDQWHIKLRY